MLPEVLERIERAAQRAGRDPRSIQLVAVTKGHTPEEIRSRVLAYGDFPLGESRIQEALPKMEVLQAHWHFIGPLQRNKAKAALRFELLHSLDSLRLAETLSHHAEQAHLQLPALIELNLSREPQKHGFLLEELPGAYARLRELPGLKLVGFMTIGRQGSPEASRTIFATLSRIADEYGLPERSMGMSDDFELAVEEGATLLRIGRALFEPLSS
jgi:pyridoxal phosphate enzyme (YggS family)